MLRIGRYGCGRRLAGEHIGKAMVDVAVVRFVGTDHEHDVAQGGVGWHVPVVAGDRRGRHVRGSAFIQLDADSACS